MTLSLMFALNLLLAQSCTPQVLVDNARIYTVDPAAPRAQAMVLDDCGGLAAVGSSKALRDRFAGLQVIDAGGLTIVPGFIDAHAHLSGLGQSMMQAQLTGAVSKTETLARLQAFERTLPEGAWLQGRGWDQNDWPENAFPTRADLDQLFPERPVWLRRIDGHAGWANGAAMALADRDFGGDWQVEGGEIIRDENGRASGIFIDRAMALIAQQVPDADEKMESEALHRALKATAAVGLTGVHEAGTSAAQLQRYRRFADQGDMTLRVYAMADGEQALLEQICAKPVVGAGVVARAVKIYADGALGSRGAALLADYSDRPENRGLLLQQPEQLARQVDRAMACGLQVNIHAIGDRANRLALDLLIDGQSRHPDNPGRHRIEHAQVITPQDLPRFAAHQVIASVQPTHATSDMYWAQERLGEQRVATAYLWQSLLTSGARLALGSDFPVELPAPMLGFYAAVTRQDARGWPPGGWFGEEVLSRAQALHGFTLGAAYAAFMEDQVGSLEAGKRADFVVLSGDIMSLAPAQLLEIKPLVTVVDGRATFQHSQADEQWQMLGLNAH